LLFTAMATVVLASHEPVSSLEQLRVLVKGGDTVTVGDSPGETASIANADNLLLKALDQVIPAARAADTWDMLPSMSSRTPLRLMLTGGSEVIGRLAPANAEAVVLENSKVRKGRHGRWIVASSPRTL
jgi:hypothetical protein